MPVWMPHERRPEWFGVARGPASTASSRNPKSGQTWAKVPLRYINDPSIYTPLCGHDTETWQVDDDIEGCFPRPTTLDISVNSREYGPTAGIKPLREAVAHLYNEMHRKDKPSKYTWENVAIVPGGRAGLIRIAAVLNNAYVGFFIPDYTGLNLPAAVSWHAKLTSCSV